jgi:antitoxin CcdA
MRIIPVETRMRSRAPAKKPTNVSLPNDLIAEARALGINLSSACERGLADAVSKERATRWQAENRQGIEAWNAYVEANGLPLARFRQF